MIRIISFLTALFIATAHAGEKPVKLFLLGGQSNMDGCGRWGELPESWKQIPANVKIWDNRELTWKNLNEDTTAIARNHMFGPELVFSHLVAKAFPNFEIRLVKTSAGGTTLAKSWLPDKQKMYPRFIANYRNALADLEKSGHQIESAGMLWMQGEGDTETLDMANVYESNLGIMLSDVRKTTGAPKLPVVMGRIASGLVKSTKWNFTNTPIVQKAQEAYVAKDPNTHLVLTDDLTVLPDHTHFDTAGQIGLGERMAKEMLKALGSSTGK